MIIGVPTGILCAYFGKRFDLVVMRVVDILMSFPTLVFGLMLVAALSPNLMNVVIAIAISLVPRFIRVARGPALSIMKKEYIESSKAIGANTGRIVFLHVLPNIAGPIAIGVQPPTPSWGNMLKAGMNRILMAPWMAIYPGIAIVISVLAFNLIGDGIRDFLDPKKQI
jgi:peptide/nickel transport system permease protein